MCRKVDESIYHIVSGCSKFAQKEYRRRHDNMGKIVYWKLARKCNFEAGDNGMNMSQKVFYRMKIIRFCGISVFILIML